MGPKLCECGCGQPAPISPVTYGKLGYVKGEPRRFIRGHANKGRTGLDSKTWRGDRSLRPDGYWMVPFPGTNGKRSTRRLEHLVIAEKVLGRPLPDGAEVHHANGIRSDNRNENLVICESRAYHRLLHLRMKAVALGHLPEWRVCSFCGIYGHPNELWIYRNNDPAHPSCKLAYNRLHRRKKG